MCVSPCFHIQQCFLHCFQLNAKGVKEFSSIKNSTILKLEKKLPKKRIEREELRGLYRDKSNLSTSIGIKKRH